MGVLELQGLEPGITMIGGGVACPVLLTGGVEMVMRNVSVFVHGVDVDGGCSPG